MDEQQKQTALGLIVSVQSALDHGIQHFSREGQRLTSVSAIIEAWVRGGGVVVKGAEHRSVVASWMRH